MNTNDKNNESNMESIAKLLKAMRYDPVINRKVMSILTMDSYPRRLVLNNWLEQLRRKNAPEQLTQALSYLFDDVIARKIFGLLEKTKQ